MSEPTHALVVTIRETLADNGISANFATGLHSWRCGYPDVYGPCSCVDELVQDLARAVLAAMPQQPEPIGYAVACLYADDDPDEWLIPELSTDLADAVSAASELAGRPTVTWATPVAIVPVQTPANGPQSDAHPQPDTRGHDEAERPAERQAEQ